jgi:dipeptide transport system substrate-binding protein
MPKSPFLSLAVAAVMAAGLAAAPLSADAKTLVFCSEGSPAGFDPGLYTANTDFDAAAETIYNRLVQFKRGSTEIEPGLAESWDVAADGLSYTFHLRKGVKFHTTATFKPTREFNAQDVIFTFERMLDKEHPFRKAYPTEFPYFEDMGMSNNITKIDAPDPFTVTFTLKTVDAPFLQNMAMSFASILSSEYADQLLKAGQAPQINQAPVGTGPFVLKSYVKDATIRFEAFKDYWKPSDIKVDHLVFAITTDPSVRIQMLKKNECQVATYPRPADVVALKDNADIAMPSQVGFNLGYLAYNVLHKPLDTIEVRQALDMAIDKKAIIDAVYQGIGQLATNPLPPTQWSYDDTLKDAPRDLEKAKQLLAKAGLANGFEITLWAMPVQRPYNPNARLMAEMIQADWAKIGVKAKIVTYEWGEYLKRAKAGEHDAMLIGWTGDNGDPDNWLGVLLGCDSVNGNNYDKWCYKPFNDLIVAARNTTDQAKRVDLYKQAQKIFKEQVPFTPIAHSTAYKPMSKDVVDFKISPFGLNSFYGVGLK